MEIETEERIHRHRQTELVDELGEEDSQDSLGLPAPVKRDAGRHKGQDADGRIDDETGIFIPMAAHCAISRHSERGGRSLLLNIVSREIERKVASAISSISISTRCRAAPISVSSPGSLA